MGGVIHLLRGINVLVPRNMVQAAGFYNTLLLSDEPGLVVEVLNGYRLKEKLPDNLSEFTVPVGVPEVLRIGSDVTIVTYGATVRIVLAAAAALEEIGVDVEVIDVQSLLPFDRKALILQSLKKTNRIVFIDEDVPGGTTAYMMQEVIENFRFDYPDPKHVQDLGVVFNQVTGKSTIEEDCKNEVSQIAPFIFQTEIKHSRSYMIQTV